MRYLLCGILMATSLIANGCTSVVVYKPSYLDVYSQNKPNSTNCKTIVYTTEADDNFVYKGRPSSATGGAYGIEMPIGILTKEIAQYAFNQACIGGALVSKDLNTASANDLIVYPKVTAFDYRYNDTKNLGLAVTTQVRVVLDVAIIDAGGHACYTGEYDSGYVDGNTALFHLSPLESVNKATHKVIYELMTRAAADIIHQKSLNI